MYYFLHGWTQDITKSQEFVDTLNKEGIETSLIVMPGFGNEPEPETVWGIQEYAEWVHTRILSQQRKDASVIGYSFGGAVAMVLTFMHPELVSSLVVISASGIRETSLQNRFKIGAVRVIKPIIECLPRSEQIKKIGRKILGAHDYQHATPHMKKVLQNVITQDVRSYIGSVEISTIFVYGTKDTATPSYFIEKLVPYFKNSKVELIEGADHYMLYNDPQTICAIIKKYQ